MKRGSEVGSRKKRSANEAEELCAMLRSFQLTVTSKTCRTPAMNGARNGPRVEVAFGVRYQFLNGTTQPDPIGSADSLTPTITIGMRAPACVRSTAPSPACHCHRWAPGCSPRTATLSRAFGAATCVVVAAATWYQRTDGSDAPLPTTSSTTSARGGATDAAGSSTATSEATNCRASRT